MREHRLYRPKSVSLKARLRTARKALLLCLFTALTLSMLLENEKALTLSLTGLNLWFEKMIPTLLPFMILSGILIRMNLSDSFARLFAPLLRPLFGLSDSCLYVLVIGFLCGFPMGARVTAESLQHGRLTHREASLMLAFCNNIGPIYFSGFVLTLFPVPCPWPFWAGMYLLPLLYGLIRAGPFTGTFRPVPGVPCRLFPGRPSFPSCMQLPFPLQRHPVPLRPLLPGKSPLSGKSLLSGKSPLLHRSPAFQREKAAPEAFGGHRLCWNRRRRPSPLRSSPSPLSAVI